MTGTDTKLMAAVRDYFEDLQRTRASGGATGELSHYPPLVNLSKRGTSSRTRYC